MRFVDVKKPGPPDNLFLSDCDDPVPQAGEVLIKVAAAGVNRPDIVQRLGFYPPPPGASPIIGLEVAGEVVDVGAEVDSNLRGQLVCALANGGGYAEYVAVPVGQCLPIPNGVSVEQAAAIPETFFTVWVNVFMRAGLRSGEHFLVHGGSSGIGYTAIQLAKAFGATVYTTAGSDEKCQFCRDVGADLAINYKSDDFVDAIQQATDGKGVDVILDMVGGDYVQKNIQIAAFDGRIANVAFLGGSNVNLDLLPVMVKRLSLSGSTLRPRTAEVKAEIAAQLREKVWPLLEGKESKGEEPEAGQVQIKIHKIFSFNDCVAAHELMESSTHCGKIVLRW